MKKFTVKNFWNPNIDYQFYKIFGRHPTIGDIINIPDPPEPFMPFCTSEPIAFHRIGYKTYVLSKLLLVSGVHNRIANYWNQI